MRHLRCLIRLKKFARWLQIGELSQIFSNFTFQHPNAYISIGRRCQLGASTFIVNKKITIGDDVIISWGCTIMDTDNHSTSWRIRKKDIHNFRKDYDIYKGKKMGISHDWSNVKTQPITICSKVWIGIQVIILKGVTIGEGSVIGAGSVVTKNINPWSIAAGNPCKTIRTIPQEERM